LLYFTNCLGKCFSYIFNATHKGPAMALAINFTMATFMEFNPKNAGARQSLLM